MFEQRFNGKQEEGFRERNSGVYLPISKTEQIFQRKMQNSQLHTTNSQKLLPDTVKSVPT